MQPRGKGKRQKHGLTMSARIKKLRETKKYIQELEGDIMPIDMLIDFAQSPAGAAVFGGSRSGCGRYAKENQSRRRRKILRLPGMCGSRGHSCKKG